VEKTPPEPKESIDHSSFPCSSSEENKQLLLATAHSLAKRKLSLLHARDSGDELQQLLEVRGEQVGQLLSVT
jgi:hypothetical protein